MPESANETREGGLASCPGRVLRIDTRARGAVRAVVLSVSGSKMKEEDANEAKTWTLSTSEETASLVNDADCEASEGTVRGVGAGRATIEALGLIPRIRSMCFCIDADVLKGAEDGAVIFEVAVEEADLATRGRLARREQLVDPVEVASFFWVIETAREGIICEVSVEEKIKRREEERGQSKD